MSCSRDTKKNARVTSEEEDRRDAGYRTQPRGRAGEGVGGG